MERYPALSGQPESVVLSAGAARRLFAAVELEPELRRLVGRSADALPGADGRLRRVSAEEAHLTLRFIGDVASDRMDAVREVLRDVALRHRPFEIRVGRLGVFPESGPSGVLWAGIEEGAERLAELARDLEEGLVRHGFAPETRRYTPHITLARLAALKGVDPYRSLTHNTLDVTGRTQLVRELALYESRPVPTGSRYSVVARAAMDGLTG